MSLGLPGDGTSSDSFATIPDVPIVSASNRVDPNQVTSGLTRGAIVTSGADGKPQILQGSQQKFGNGFYVAKPGHDVVTETDPANFVFNSSQNVFKIVASGSSNSPATGTITSTAGTWSTGFASVIIAHSLGYVPIPWVFINTSGLYIPIPYTATSGTGTNGSTWYTVNFSSAVDATNLYVNVWVSVFGGSANQLSLPLKWYLLQETAN